MVLEETSFLFLGKGILYMNNRNTKIDFIKNIGMKTCAIALSLLMSVSTINATGLTEDEGIEQDPVTQLEPSTVEVNSSILLNVGEGKIEDEGWTIKEDESMDSNLYFSDTATSFPTPTIEDDTKQFVGWYNDEDYTNEVDVPQAGNTYYAKWKTVEITSHGDEVETTSVNQGLTTLYTGGGTISDVSWSGNNNTYTSESATSFPIPTMKDSATSFEGWYEDSTYTTKATLIEAGKTYYAKWVRSANSVSNESMTYEYKSKGINAKLKMSQKK